MIVPFSAAQTLLESHTTPQAPQLVGSCWMSTQAEPHCTSPGAQLDTHMPLLHTLPAPHACPQLPQLAALLPRSTQTPAHAVAPNGQVAIASYYVDRYVSGSPEHSWLDYSTRNDDGTWTTVTAVTTPDGYVAADGPRFTGFTGGVIVTGPTCVTFQVSSPRAREATVTVPIGPVPC